MVVFGAFFLIAASKVSKFCKPCKDSGSVVPSLGDLDMGKVLDIFRPGEADSRTPISAQSSFEEAIQNGFLAKYSIGHNAIQLAAKYQIDCFPRMRDLSSPCCGCFPSADVLKNLAPLPCSSPLPRRDGFGFVSPWFDRLL